MHTIESSVLVPLGLGLIGMLLLLTFYLHDQTVLTAEYSSLMLEWQACQGAWDDETGAEKSARWEKKLLMTEVEMVSLAAGNNLCRLQTKERYRLFDQILNMMEQSFSGTKEVETEILVKVNPCWLKRIWKVVEGE